MKLVPMSLVLGLLAPLPVLAGAVPVKIERSPAGAWQLLRGGQPYSVRGVGGFRHLDTAAECGATTLRTWSATHLEPEPGQGSLLDEAHRRGLTVLVGLWLAHERHGYSYANEEFLRKQREEVRASVRAHRDHPAVLAWGLGNEMEGLVGAGDPLRVWKEIEALARIIKEEDPAHPVVTVIAGASLEKIRAVQQHCPSVDILGINSYGPAALATHALDAVGWEKPFMLTEFGPRGPWEIAHTPWNAPIEPRMGEKIANYVGAHRAALADPRQRCLGTFCFTWGQKQEATATWFGMFLATGEKTPLVDVMAYEFRGAWPANRSPEIVSLKAPFAFDRVPPGVEFTVTARLHDPENDALKSEWLVIAESTDRKNGGDPEQAPDVHPECIILADVERVVLRTPARSGAYRLFLYVRDGHGGGTTENIPFYVRP